MDIRHKASFSVSIYTHLWPQSVSQFSMSSYLGQASTLKHLFSEKKKTAPGFVLFSDLCKQN